MYDVDINELVLKALKYLFQGLMIAIVAYLLDMIGPNKLNTWEIAILSAKKLSPFLSAIRLIIPNNFLTALLELENTTPLKSWRNQDRIISQASGLANLLGSINKIV